MEQPVICVIGLGTIGLPTAVLLADQGHRVIGVDINPDRVCAVNSGTIDTSEPYLNDILRCVVGAGNLTAFDTPNAADIFFICAPTTLSSSKLPDLTAVEQAAEAISSHLHDRSLVIIESTTTVGTSHRIQQRLRDLRPDLATIQVAAAPERGLPGRLVEEWRSNDRIVGGVDPDATQAAAAFFRTVLSGDILCTDARTAELCKLIENASRDVNLALVNEVSLICDQLGVNLWELIRLANRHPRVSLLWPGPGVGGACIPIASSFITSSLTQDLKLLPAARATNLYKEEWVIARVLERAMRLEAPTVAVLGLTYKADTADARHSPALAIARRLHAALGDRLIAVEPHLSEADVPLVSLEEALKSAQLVVALVGHRAFSGLSRRYLASKDVFDVCGLFT